VIESERSLQQGHGDWRASSALPSFSCTLAVVAIAACALLEHQFQMEQVSWRGKAYPYRITAVPNGTVPWNRSLILSKLRDGENSSLVLLKYVGEAIFHNSLIH